MEGKQVVDDGVRWKVGDAKTIEVWKEKWLKKDTSSPPIPPNVQPTPLPLSRAPMSDKLLWMNFPNGSLTVKNAYVTARKLLGKEVLTGPNVTRGEEWYGLLTCCLKLNSLYGEFCKAFCL